MSTAVPEGFWFHTNERMLAILNRHHPTPEFGALTPHQRALFAIAILDVEIGSRGVGAMLGRGCVWLLPIAIPALDALSLHDRARLLEEVESIASELGIPHRDPGITGRKGPVKDSRFDGVDAAWKQLDRREFNRVLSDWVAEHRAEFPAYPGA